MPHSDIHGSKPARGSPWLFAACHVLHRLLVPRHPPNALLSLNICRHAPRRTCHPPCTETILSCSRQSRQLSVVTDNRDRTPNADAKNRSCTRIISLSTQHSSLNTLPRSREDPSRRTDHIRSDVRPRRAQRRTRT